MMSPNRPRTELKISMTRILTKLRVVSLAYFALIAVKLTVLDRQHLPVRHYFH